MSAAKKAAIIGAGVIGAGWAARFVLNGWDVAVHDPGPGAEDAVANACAAARKSLSALYDRPLPAEGTVTFTSLEEAATGAAWVQESAPERAEVKAEILTALDKAAPAEAILASSTSGFRPSVLCAGLNPDRVIVAHPFNPVYLIPLVELVAHPEAREDLSKAEAILTGLGMAPLIVRKEIDAHIADRLLEAVWREALWLVNDGVATTGEIDRAIKLGFGLRWAQMGLFETYRIAGGPGGMAQFMAQFGPALAWPWTKLMDVPELTPELIAKIAQQSDEQAGAESIAALSARRDTNLVALLLALKARDDGAGAILNAHEASLKE